MKTPLKVVAGISLLIAPIPGGIIVGGLLLREAWKELKEKKDEKPNNDSSSD